MYALAYHNNKTEFSLFKNRFSIFILTDHLKMETTENNFVFFFRNIIPIGWQCTVFS